MVDPDVRLNEATHRLNRIVKLEEVVKTITLLIVAALVVVVIGLSVFTLSKLQEIRRIEKQNACIARGIAHFGNAVGDAFSAPPAPNPKRDAAVTKLHDTSNVLGRVERVCP